MRILMTSGGCEEPVDGVRYLTNFSTGRTGAVLAALLQGAGNRVTLLAGRQAELPPVPTVKKQRYSSFQDLSRQLDRELQENYDCLIMAAAVSDFGVATVQVDGKDYPPGSGKIPSGEAPVLTLKKHPKLIGLVKESHPGLPVIGFKLTNTPDQTARKEAVNKLFQSANPDYIIANDLSEIGPDRHTFHLYAKEGVMARGENKYEMGQAILTVLDRIQGEKKG